MESKRWHRLQKLFHWQKDPALYRPLKLWKEFRLLLLHAGKAGDPVQADLRLARLNGLIAPHYETISYCWGDPTITATIYLDKKESSVPASSIAALRCVRLPHRDRIVWIDAVCINQADLDERAQQVSMMADIYCSSNGNLVYLGEEDEYTERVAESIHKVVADTKKRTDNFLNTKDTPFDPRGERYFYHNVSCNADERALVHLFSNSWFRRVWVFQEAVLAPANLCFLGSTRIELLDIVRAAQWMYFHEGTYSFELRVNRGLACAGELHHLIDKALGFHYTIRQPSLTSLLDRSRSLLASDPRDHIYGILGLWTRSGKDIRTELTDILLPDYRKSVEAVFRDATRVALMEIDDFTPWQNLSHRTEEDLLSDMIPSWALKLNQPFDDNQKTGQSHSAADKGRKHQRTKIKFTNQDIISARGICLGGITDVTTCFTNVLAVDDVMLRTWTNELVAKIRREITNKAVTYDEIAETLLGGEGLEGDRATWQDCRDFLSFLSVMDDQHAPIPALRHCTPATPSHIRSAAKFKTRMIFSCVNRRMLMTDTSHIGIGPKLTRAGDVVVILYGGKFPVVLRPVGEAYRLVGECYVAGAMEGEVVRRHQEAGKPDMEFRIQ